MRFDKDKIKEEMTIEETIEILNQLGSEYPIEDKGKNPIFTTVCHNECNGKHKLYYYQESKQFHCYTSCGETMDIYGLVIKSHETKGISLTFKQAVEWVAFKLGKSYGFGFKMNNIEKNTIMDDWKWLRKFDRKEKKEIILPEYDENVLDVFINKPHESWINEGITPETINKYEIGYYLKAEQISIVHRDVNNRLVGIRGRSMLEEDVKAGRKYIPITCGGTLYNHMTSVNLYGINHNVKNIKKLRKVMLVEGEKSVLKAEDFYGEDNFTVGLSSSNVSSHQVEMILSLGVDEVFIALDKIKDDATEKQIDDYKKKLLKIAYRFAPYCQTYIIYDDWDLLEEKDSPLDKGKNTLEKLMRLKYEINTINEVESN
jgi:hypothetical protein